MIKGLDFRLTIAQGAFQRRPDEWLRQRIERIEDQVAAIGPMQRSGPNAHEVAAPHATVFEGRLNSTKEIFVGWGGLKDDRHALGIRVVDNDVDLIFVERILFVQRWWRYGWCGLFARGCGGSEKTLEVFVARLLNLLKILLHLRIGERRRGMHHGLPDQRAYERTFDSRRANTSLSFSFVLVVIWVVVWVVMAASWSVVAGAVRPFHDQDLTDRAAGPK